MFIYKKFASFIFNLRGFETMPVLNTYLHSMTSLTANTMKICPLVFGDCTTAASQHHFYVKKG